MIVEPTFVKELGGLVRAVGRVRPLCGALSLDVALSNSTGFPIFLLVVNNKQCCEYEICSTVGAELSFRWTYREAMRNDALVANG